MGDSEIVSHLKDFDNQAKNLKMEVHGTGYLSKPQLEHIKSESERLFRICTEMTDSLKVLEQALKLHPMPK